MRYRIFGQHTGLRVSELILGTGMFSGQDGATVPTVTNRVVCSTAISKPAAISSIRPTAISLANPNPCSVSSSRQPATISWSPPSTPRAPTPKAACRSQPAESSSSMNVEELRWKRSDGLRPRLNVRLRGTISGSRRSMSAVALVATIERTSLEIRKVPIREVTSQLSLSSCSLALLRSGVLNPSVNHS
jgi:hypothetical protein